MNTPASKGRAVATGKPLPTPAPAAKPPLKPVRVKSRGIKNSSHRTEPAPAPAPVPKNPDPKPKTPEPKNPEPSPETKRFAKPELLLPTNEGAVVNNLIARTMDDGPPAEPVSEIVNVIIRLSQAFASGADISDIRTSLVRIISNQPEKADMLQGVMNTLDHVRTADWAEVRALVEKELKRAVKSGKATTSECLAIWNIANTAIEKNQAKSAKMNKPVDSANVQKVDISQIESEHFIQQKWEGTTPQGRQIIRMKLFELKRHVAVEIEQRKKEEEEEEPVIDIK